LTRDRVKAEGYENAIQLRNWFLIITILTGLLFSSVVGSYAASVTNTYDELNRSTRVEYADGTRIDYAYDEMGNRSQVISTFPCSVAAAKIGSISYSSLQTAYNAAGNGDTIKCRDLRFTENLVINSD
jgi:YD repeat-containing protein